MPPQSLNPLKQHHFLTLIIPISMTYIGWMYNVFLSSPQRKHYITINIHKYTPPLSTPNRISTHHGISNLLHFHTCCNNSHHLFCCFPTHSRNLLPMHQSQLRALHPFLRCVFDSHQRIFRLHSPILGTKPKMPSLNRTQTSTYLHTIGGEPRPGRRDLRQRARGPAQNQKRRTRLRGPLLRVGIGPTIHHCRPVETTVHHCRYSRQ